MKIKLAYWFVALGILVGCFHDNRSAVEVGNEQQILHIGNGSEPSDIDPHITTGVPENHIQLALFEGLVSKNSTTLDIVPGVAESWQVSDDGLRYTFRLRKNARWSNGDALVAEDFVWSWYRALLPSLGNQYAYAFFGIKNAERFNKGEITDFNLVGVKARDNYTLDVELVRPVPYFLELLDHHAMDPVHRATIEKFGAPGDRGTAWTKPENFVGNGPFVMKEWVPNKVVVVEKNAFYWDEQSVKLQEIHFYPIDKAATEERMFRAGQLHIIRQLPTDKIAHYQSNHPMVYRFYPNFTTYFYRFNTSRPPLDDIRVRQALAYAIDRQQIVERVTRGGQPVARSFIPPMQTGYRSSASMPEDIERARELLAEAGYPDGKNFPTLTILYNTDEDHQKIALVIQQMWKKALNIQVKLESQEWKVFFAAQRTGNYDIVRGSWSGDFYDPKNFMDVFRADNGNNRTGWANAEYEALIQQAEQTSDQSKRFALFQQAEAILLAEAPIMPIYTYTSNALVAESVKEWHNNIMDYWSYKHVYLDPGATSSSRKP